MELNCFLYIDRCYYYYFLFIYNYYVLYLFIFCDLNYDYFLHFLICFIYPYRYYCNYKFYILLFFFFVYKTIGYTQNGAKIKCSSSIYRSIFKSVNLIFSICIYIIVLFPSPKYIYISNFSNRALSEFITTLLNC